MTIDSQTDYQSYKEIMGDLTLPIPSNNLDIITLKKLYESKLVYLENLRIRCFCEVNSKLNTEFTLSDYKYILKAQHSTQGHLRCLIFTVLTKTLTSLSRLDQYPKGYQELYRNRLLLYLYNH